MVETDTLKAPNPWVPVTDLPTLKVLGKLVEETTELGTAAGRCIIQGINEAEPTTGKVNRQWLSDELADVLAMIELTIHHFGLDAKAIVERKSKKVAHQKAWHAMLPSG